jgi:DNA-binding transcriptional MerR regulator
MKAQPSKLRISELARLSGVSIATVKHYLNAGLLPRPVKTGKTMAYYDSACVARIQAIKRLQREKYLPLDVIKRLLDAGNGYEEELALSQALLKTHPSPGELRTVPESQIAKTSGYPLRKVRLLEAEGLIQPSISETGKFYDSIDLQIIEIARRREELGLPLEYSLETLGFYRDAVEQAVARDVRIFAARLLGELPASKTIQFLTEADDSLDRFMVLFRRRTLRQESQRAIRQFDELALKLPLMILIPVPGVFLPARAPATTELRLIQKLCAGDAKGVLKIADLSSGRDQSLPAAATIIAEIMRGETGKALAIAQRHFPRPGAHSYENAAAALACMFSLRDAHGFSGPMAMVKKALGYLDQIAVAPSDSGFLELISGYVCGALYVSLPDIFGRNEQGLELLTKVEVSLSAGSWRRHRLSEWLARTLDDEIQPELEARLNLFLAEGYLRGGDAEAAGKRFSRVLSLAEPGSALALWAKEARLGLRERRRRGPRP